MTAHARSSGPGYLALMSLGALGVVYGDIGTSPLYAFRESFAVADLEGWLHWLSTADGQIVSRVRAVDSKVSAPLVTNGSSVFVYGEDGELASVSAP